MQDTSLAQLKQRITFQVWTAAAVIIGYVTLAVIVLISAISGCYP